MKKCSACDYLMDDFDPICPRCQGRGVPLHNAPPPSRPVNLNIDIKQDIINGLTGFLMFLLPALFIVLFFYGHIENNPASRSHKLDVGWMPIIFVSGAALGAWIGSGLPRFQWKFSAILGGIAAFALALISPALIGDSGETQYLLLYSVLFLAMLCGGVGSVLRHRNLVSHDDSLLIKQVGVAVLCFAAPLIGLFVSISLGKNGSDYAAPALYGSITGFVVIGLPLVIAILGR